ncbi:MAG TPA: hypothetical protein VI542_34465, partial [Candidatus Tectomicrobia bacterium]
AMSAISTGSKTSIAAAHRNLKSDAPGGPYRASGALHGAVTGHDVSVDFDHRVGRLWALSMMSESSCGLYASEPHRLCYPYGVPWVCHTTAQGKVVPTFDTSCCP